MNDTEIEELLKLLRAGVRRTDWDKIIDAIEYLEEFSASDEEES